MKLLMLVLLPLLLAFGVRILFILIEDRLREWRHERPGLLHLVGFAALMFAASIVFVDQILSEITFRLIEISIPVPVLRFFEYPMARPGHISLAKAFYIASFIMVGPVSLEFISFRSASWTDARRRGTGSDSTVIATFSGFAIGSYKGALTLDAVTLSGDVTIGGLGLLGLWVALMMRIATMVRRETVWNTLLHAGAPALAWTALAFVIWS